MCLSRVGVDNLPGGYCSIDCHGNVVCPTGSECVDFGFGVRLCVANCPPSSCRAGYSCCSVGGGANACVVSNACD
jgi:hypothetical protein